MFLITHTTVALNEDQGHPNRSLVVSIIINKCERNQSVYVWIQANIKVYLKEIMYVGHYPLNTDWKQGDECEAHQTTKSQQTPYSIQINWKLSEMLVHKFLLSHNHVTLIEGQGHLLQYQMRAMPNACQPDSQTQLTT